MDIRSVALVLALAGCSCCATKASSPNDGVPRNPPASTELLAVLFKEGKPSAGDSLPEAVTDAEFTVSALKRDAEIINRVEALRFQVVGTTDNKECDAQECIELSLRRAKLVHAWLVNYGVSESKLKPPVGRGDQAPLTDNSTEAARSANRRAIVDFVLEQSH
jgi:hypothetical protein